MSDGEDDRHINFQAPVALVERLDTIAEIVETDRRDLLVDAIRSYIADTTDSESFKQRVATEYYDDTIEFETVKQLIGAATAQRLCLLKADLESEPFDIAAPDDRDIYADELSGVDTDDTVDQ